MKQKKRLIIGALLLATGMLVAWKIKPVELIDDKLLIDLDTAIVEADWGQEGNPGDGQDKPSPEEGEDILISVQGENILLNGEIQGVYYSNTHVGLLFYDQTGENKYRLDVYDASGKKDMSHGFDMDFKDILIRNDQIMIYNEAQCIVVGLNGTVKYTGTFENKVHFAAATDSPRKYILIMTDGLATMEFN